MGQKVVLGLKNKKREKGKKTQWREVGKNKEMGTTETKEIRMRKNTGQKNDRN
jgi:hypothetical protein